MNILFQSLMALIFEAKSYLKNTEFFQNINAKLYIIIHKVYQANNELSEQIF